jgi:TonB-dependent Receptor Plug Domain.
MMKNRARIAYELSLYLPWLLFSFFVIPAFAQVSTANMTGVVQDKTSANIRDANVKLINVQTGTENDSKTDRDGRFVLPGIIPGTYTLQIERPGFATTQLNGIVLNVGDTKSLLVRLKVGSVSESVNVDASGLTLNNTDASVSTLVDRKFVSNIPLNGRSFQDLISMTPGVVTQSPQAAGEGSSTQGDFSVNGQRPESNSFFVDGVSANVNSGLTNDHSRLTTSGPGAGATALGTTQTLVSVEALQEFRVLSSTYSAEYGRTPGGQFTFLTRSGTSTIHGSFYTYWRGSNLDAPDWFISFIEPDAQYHSSFSQKDIGGTWGMPIRFSRQNNGSDKTFLFLSYENLLLTQPSSPALQYAPSPALRQEQGFAQSFLDYFPYSYNDVEIKDVLGKPSGLTTFIARDPDSYPARVNSTSVRLDHTFFPKLSVFLRYGDTPSYSKTLQLSTLTINRARTRTFTLGAISQLSTTMSNDLRLGLIRSKSSIGTEFSSRFSGDSSLSAETFNRDIGIPDPSRSARAEAYIHIDGVGDTEVNTDSGNSSLGEWNLRDSFDLKVSNHFFNFGIDQRHIDSTTNPAPLSIEADFFSRQAMVDNTASGVVITKNVSASPALNEFSAFAQDEWRASKALTLSFGVRWEINPPPKGRAGKDAYTAVGDINSPATLRLAPRGSPLWHTSWFNLAPRFGAAWMVKDRPGREMILRAGAGVFFDTGNRAALSAFSGRGFRTTAHLKDISLPVAPAYLDFSNTSTNPALDATTFVFPSHLQLPYSVQWNIGLEKALGKNQALTISYVGARGSRLLQEERKNISQLNPTFSDISFFPNGVTSNYQSLQLKFQRSIAHGVQALASYTWAHSLDYGSTDPLYPLTYGNSDLDVRHNLEGAISWDLPKPGRSRLLRYVFDGWGLDGRLIARTAFPVTLMGNLLSDPATREKYYNGVDLTPNRPLYLYGSQYPGGRIINGGPNATDPAFSLPGGTLEGNAPRNFVRGFNAVQVNAALRREFPIYDRLALQFQAEAFNVLNHPNFGYIDPSLSDALFGQSTKMLNQSFGATGSLYQQGGPRSVQFSFKVTF